MIFEGEFFYGEHLRWNLWWPSPNYAGAFLATTLPLAWAIHTYLCKLIPKQWIISVLWLGVESAVCFYLCKTYSRGSLLAALIALTFYFIFDLHRTRQETRDGVNGCASTLGDPWRQLAIRIAILVVCLYVTGFNQRVAQTSLSDDPSVGNRWEFWQACTEMMVNSPWRGWGVGESGGAYMNWFQRVDRHEGFITPVNSFLHLGVEYGFPIFILALFVISLPLFEGTRLQLKAGNQHGRIIYLAASAALLAWIVANCFSSLWQDLRLWGMPALALGIISYGIVTEGQIRQSARTALLSLVGATTVATGLYGIGASLGRERKVVPTLTQQGTVLLTLNKKISDGSRVMARLDETVLGLFPGKEIRRWLTNTKSVLSVEVVPKSPPIAVDYSKFSHVLLFGRQAERAGLMSVPADIWLIHPQGKVPETADLSALTIKMILPEIDQKGDRFRWEKWARSHNVEIKNSPGCGNDIRAQWPMVMPEW